MISKAATPEQYLKELPTDRKVPFNKLRDVILASLPRGYEERMAYGMIGYVVPHSLYPPGYHVNPKLPLGLMWIASQKNFIGLYHMGIYGKPELLKWFTEDYKKQSPTKLDMGKGCIRLKPQQIPYKLIGELAGKISVKDWIKQYETNLKNARKKKAA